MGVLQVISDACWVVAEGNDLILYGPNGEDLPCQEALTATADIADGLATCNVSFVCNIAGSKEEMMKKIKEMEAGGKAWIEKEQLDKISNNLKANKFIQWAKTKLFS